MHLDTTRPVFDQNPGANLQSRVPPPLDFVFTVCDNAAGETCPVWPGQPMTAHWGIPDPAEAKGSEAEIALAFKDAYRMLFQAHRDIHRDTDPQSQQTLVTNKTQSDWSNGRCTSESR